MLKKLFQSDAKEIGRQIKLTRPTHRVCVRIADYFISYRK